MSHAAIANNRKLTLGLAFRFFAPLATSWLLMSLEGPSVIVFVTRLPDADITLAAITVMMTLSFWIESPVIGLLSTSTALAINRQHYLVLRRFVVMLIVLVTLAAAVVSLTPLYDIIVGDLLQVPPRVLEAARPGLQIMIPWSGFIGWRRYTQGILIRYGHTQVISRGTVLRVLGILAVAGILFYPRTVPGPWVAAGGMLGGVVLECIFVHLAARSVIKREFSKGGASSEQGLTMSDLTHFHLPLSLSNMMWLIGRPILVAGLARGWQPVVSLAAWEPAGSLMFLFRAPTMALPEAVIALQRNRQTLETLRNFCAIVGLVCTAVLLLLLATPFGWFLLTRPLHIEERVAELVIAAMIFSSLVPALGGLQSYYRGMLSASRNTTTLFWAMCVYLIALSTAVVLTVYCRQMNVRTAAICLTIALMAELVFLYCAWRSVSRRLSSSYTEGNQEA